MKGALLLVLLVLLVAWASRVLEGRSAVREAEAATKRGDLTAAIVAARTAADARCPFCESSELGYARLYAIAKDAESHGDDATAIASWRAVHAAALSSSMVDVTSSQRERADAEIARLGHRLDVAAVTAGATATPAATEERLRASLTPSDLPGGLTLLLLASGGALFLAAAARLGSSRVFRRRELAFAASGIAIAIAGVLLF